MTEELFDELVASVCEGGAILRGEMVPSRKFVIDEPKAKGISETAGSAQPTSDNSKRGN